MATSPDEIKLTDQQQRQLAILADLAGKPWAEVLGEALTRYQSIQLATENRGDESFYDRAKRLGLIGCVEGGPPDLSTNPKHMEGFGESGS